MPYVFCGFKNKSTIKKRFSDALEKQALYRVKIKSFLIKSTDYICTIYFFDGRIMKVKISYQKKSKD